MYIYIYVAVHVSHVPFLDLPIKEAFFKTRFISVDLSYEHSITQYHKVSSVGYYTNLTEKFRVYLKLEKNGL